LQTSKLLNERGLDLQIFNAKRVQINLQICKQITKRITLSCLPHH